MSDNFRAEIQRTGNRRDNYGLTKSSVVAKRPRDAPCRWKLCCQSLEIIRTYTVQ